MPAKYRTRVCATCKQRKPVEEMRRCALVSRWVCAGCPEPARAEPEAVGRSCPLCDREAKSNGLCHTHEMRWRRWGKPPLEEWIAAFREGRLCTCVVCGAHFNSHKGSVVCGLQCKHERARRSILEKWRALPPEGKAAWKERSTGYRKAKTERRKRKKKCLICKTEFIGQQRRVLCGRPGCKAQLASQRSREYRQRLAEEQMNNAANKLEDLQ